MLVRPPGTAVPDGLMFYAWCIFFSLFFSPRVLRAPSTDRPETLPRDRNMAVFYNPATKIRGGGAPPKKFGGQKHAKFRSILDHFRLWSRISPERLKISKIGWRYELWQFLMRLTKKSGELWSTNGLEFHVILDPLKIRGGGAPPKKFAPCV